MSDSDEEDNFESLMSMENYSKMSDNNNNNNNNFLE